MADGDRHTTEISRLTSAIEKLDGSVNSLERRIADTYVRKDVYNAHRERDAKAGENLASKVDALVALRDWALKLVVGAIILALLGLVITSNTGGI